MEDWRKVREAEMGVNREDRGVSREVLEESPEVLEESQRDQPETLGGSGEGNFLPGSQSPVEVAEGLEEIPAG